MAEFNNLIHLFNISTKVCKVLSKSIGKFREIREHCQVLCNSMQADIMEHNIVWWGTWSATANNAILFKCHNEREWRRCHAANVFIRLPALRRLPILSDARRGVGRRRVAAAGRTRPVCQRRRPDDNGIPRVVNNARASSSHMADGSRPELK